MGEGLFTYRLATLLKAGKGSATDWALRIIFKVANMATINKSANFQIIVPWSLSCQEFSNLEE